MIFNEKYDFLMIFFMVKKKNVFYGLSYFEESYDFLMFFFLIFILFFKCALICFVFLVFFIRIFAIF